MVKKYLHYTDPTPEPEFDPTKHNPDLPIYLICVVDSSFQDLGEYTILQNWLVVEAFIEDVFLREDSVIYDTDGSREYRRREWVLKFKDGSSAYWVEGRPRERAMGDPPKVGESVWISDDKELAYSRVAERDQAEISIVESQVKEYRAKLNYLTAKRDRGRHLFNIHLEPISG
jgi:hypothetical protein